MDELEEQIMQYAERVNDWFTPRQAFNAIFPDKTFSSTKWETYKFMDRHRSLTKYGFLERETFHPEGTGYTRYHYRIKRD